MTRIPLNDLGRGLVQEQASLVAAVSAVIESGWLVHGPFHAKFETTLADYVGATHAVGVASGTDALELAIRATMPPGRDSVVTAANCGGYTTVAARRAGYEVVYADIDESSLCIDADALSAVLTERVGIVVVTHLYGRAADVEAVNRLCRDRGISVVEDCAQAIGATTPAGPVGGLADAAAFSFYPTKNLAAIGDGGAVTTNSPETAAKVRELRQYGWSKKYTIAHDGGRNSRLDEIQAAVLLQRLATLREKNERRRAIVSLYSQRASERLRVVSTDDEGFVGHLAVVVSEDRQDLVRHLEAAGIQSDVHYPVLDHLQPAYADDYAHISLPVTERLAGRILSVPVFPEMRDDEVEQVCRALESF